MDRPIDQIRAATAEAHARLDGSPYARAVLDGSLRVADYASFLRAFHVVHLALEHVLELTTDATLRGLFGHTRERRALLEQDLTHLGVDPNGVDFAALAAAVLAQKVRLLALRDRQQLLGFAYVLEGSQLGGLVQRNALAGRPELARGGLAYLTGQGKDTRAIFQAFVTRLEAALSDHVAIARALAGALTAFAGFQDILEAIMPSEHAPRWLVGELNRDAGSHVVPDDAREVLAALRAGETTWQQYAYYEARYGERGRRFTGSDSAWLVTLAREEVPQAERHVSWLARVLASRGMPRMLLEHHLHALHDALCAALPARSESYEALRAAAARLTEERTRALSEQTMQTLVAAHVASRPDALTCECGITPAEAATLVVAAVADERCKIAGAVESLTDWLLDAGRFSAAWRSAVAHTLASARAAAA